MIATLPITAWEQAAVVCLFTVMAGGLLGWTDRQLQNIRRQQKDQQAEWQNFIDNENTKWQNFIRDERLVSAGARKEDREKLDELTQALTHLTELIIEFRSDFNAHVISEDTKFEMMLDAKSKADLENRIGKKRGAA